MVFALEGGWGRMEGMGTMRARFEKNSIACFSPKRGKALTIFTMKSRSNFRFLGSSSLKDEEEDQYTIMRLY